MTMTGGKKHSAGRYPEIAIVGAGVSGICAAIQLQKQLGLDSFTIFERNSEVGGTWLTNTYPGCACDIESHLYSFSFEPNPNWTSKYSSQQEIWEYFKGLATKYDVYSHTKFNTHVKSITWDEHLWKWIVVSTDLRKLDSGDEERSFDLIIIASGALRIPNFPKEFAAFQGPLLHSAAWDHGISLQNRKVAVIGTGASAIQIIPEIVDDVKELHVYQRKPAYVIPKHQFKFPNIIKWIFANIPLFMWIFRCLIFVHREIMFPVFKPKSYLHKWANQESRRYRKKKIPENESLLKALTPQYAYGCKRILVSDNYYTTMALPKVTLHTDNVDKVVGKTIYTSNGQFEEVDIMILATGYHTQDYFAPMEAFGVKGENILKSWKKYGPQTYLGIVSRNMPNVFTLLGPNTVLGHNSVIFQIECQVNFMIATVKEMIRRKARYMHLKPSAEKDFMETLKLNMKNTGVVPNADLGTQMPEVKLQLCGHRIAHITGSIQHRLISQNLSSNNLCDGLLSFFCSESKLEYKYKFTLCLKC